MKQLSARQKAEIEQLVRDHLELVAIIANTVRKTMPISVELDDMVQEGRIGLMQAAMRFDAASGVPFRQYAQFRIRGAIVDAFRRRNYRWELHAELPDESRLTEADNVPKQMIDPAPLPDEQADQARQKERGLQKLDQARELLTKRERAAITLWSEGNSYREIATRYRLSMYGSFQLVQGALKKLREEMKLAG